MDKNEEKANLTLKPRYNVFFNILYNHLTTLIIIILILVVLISEKQLVGYGVAILIIYLIYIIINSVYNKCKYRNSFYKFYTDRLEYKNKLRDDEKAQIVKYTDMTQIKYSQTFLQTIFKIGTIIIYTNNKKLSKKLIFIHDIKDVKLIYEKIIRIMGQKATDNK